MLVINILQGLLGRGPIFLNLHQLYGLYRNLFYEIKQLPQVYQAEGRSKLRLSYFRGILVF